MHLQCVAADICFKTHREPLQVRFKHHAASAAAQRLQNRPFPGSQINRACIAACLACRHVNFNVAYFYNTRTAGRCTTHQGAQTGAQLFRRKRFDQVVISPTVQALNAVRKQVAGCHHQGGCVVAARAPGLQPRQARAIGQLPVDQQRIVGFAVQGLGLAQAAAPVNKVLLQAQKVPQAFTQNQVVFNQQQSHGVVVCSTLGASQNHHR